MKPVELVARAIQNSSKPGGMVLDTFAGSGSTLIACEQTGRCCLTMEIDQFTHFANVLVPNFSCIFASLSCLNRPLRGG
jgi:adenine specific DNA methylase Mod